MSDRPDNQDNEPDVPDARDAGVPGDEHSAPLDADPMGSPGEGPAESPPDWDVAHEPAPGGPFGLQPPAADEDLSWADDAVEEEPEPEYELPSSRPSSPADMVAGVVGEPVGAIPQTPRTPLSCHLLPESEAEIERLWGHVFFAVEHPSPRAIIVTAARRGDGATQIASSLALVGAASNRELRVVLIDFNLRNPRIAEVFGIASSPGLTEVLDGRATLESAIKAIVLPNGNELHVLPGGSPVSQPLGLIKSRQVEATIRRLAERYDHAIFDCTAANAHPDPQVIGALVDGAVLVARASGTPRETVADAKKRLDFAGVTCLGLVMNQRSDPVPDMFYQNF